ncbi:DUF1295 domain-containing protein [Phaeocystidibacter luteus]|uniref:DUF1295 domain-containing protein n=1 Tax=Phaeocystidibacter luteus TaxID=911197 RepID=A0A6N6RMT5_9FLAO|nr:DUF1295 domain-containing protein [Phaeocystidibacter luteus]KAB2814862.1 DUF1295 domain-containing protein [Phaeocystidibacter luteus]
MGKRFIGLLTVLFWYILAPYSFIQLFNWPQNPVFRVLTMLELPLPPIYNIIFYATLWMTVVIFIASILARNSSMYDAYWSVAPLYFVLVLPLLNSGYELHWNEILITFVIVAWSVRLTGNWIYTWPGLHHQDWRYTALREKSKWAYPLVNFFGIHLFPTLMVFIAFIPAIYVFNNASYHVGWLTILATVVGLAAVLLQGTADYQMHQFRRRRSGGVNKSGLWKYSRHPNYLGEILLWVSVYLFGLDAGMPFWPGILCPLSMVLMFVFISIPMMEKRQAHKPGWQEYVANTGMLLPKRFSK